MAGGFEEIVNNLLSPNNDARKKAESDYDSAKASQPLEVANGLVKMMGGSPSEEVRKLAAVLLRRSFERRDETSSSTWTQLGPEAQNGTQAVILQCLQTEMSTAVRSSVVHLMAEIAALQLEEGRWPELLPAVFHWSKSDQPWQRELALDCFEKIAEYASGTVRPHSQEIGKILVAGLSDTANSTVRIAALRAVSSLLLALESNEELKPFKEVVPHMMNVLVHALQEGDEAPAREGLKALVDVAALHPKFLREHLDLIKDTITTIVSAANLEESTRQISLELVLSIAENAPSMVRKNAGLVAVIVPLSMELIAQGTDPEFDVNEWDEQEEEDDTFADGVDEPLSQFGEEAVDRLARALGGNTILPIVSNHLPAFLQDGDWRKRRAALLSVAMLAEGCGKLFYAQVEGLMPQVIRYFSDPHPRVRAAAIQVVGQLSIDFSEEEKCGKNRPNFQTLMAPSVLGPLCLSLQESFTCSDPAQGAMKQPWRVRGRAASALICFCSPDCCDAKSIRPFVAAILENLFNLIHTGPRQVKEEALTAISNIAGVLNEEFGKYYEHFMPLAKEILEKATGKEENMLRGKAMECIGLIGQAVGKERFAPDAKYIMELFMRVGQSFDDMQDDTTKTYLTQACSRICDCLEEEFLPYMHMVMPGLLEGALKEVEITMVRDFNEMNSAQARGLETVNLPVRGFGERQVAINTSALQEKNNACMALFTYASSLKSKFYPFVPAVAEALIPLINFKLHESIQISAVCTMPELVKAMYLGIEERGGNDFKPAQELLMAILPALFEAFDSIQTIEDLKVLGECLATCLRVAAESGGLKDGDADQLLADPKPACLPKFGVPLNQVDEVLASIVNVIEFRIQERLERRAEAEKDEDFDQDALDALNESEEEEEELMTDLLEAIGYLIKAHRQAIIPSFDKTVRPMAEGFLKLDIPNLVALAVCLFDDVVEFAAPDAQRYVAPVAERLIHFCDHPDINLRQCAVYGLGVFAQHGGQSFDQFARPAFDVLARVIAAPDSRSEDLDRATDNAISAIHKLCLFRSHCNIKPEEVLPHWLSWLPSSGDPQEARISHLHLMRYAEAGSPYVVGAAGEHWTKVLSVFAETISVGLDPETMLYDEDDALCSPDTRQRVPKLLEKLMNTNPQRAQTSLAELSEEQRQTLQFFSTSDCPALQNSATPPAPQ